MSLSNLPNEVFSQILDLIPFQDKKTCMLICHAWHDRFQSVVLKNLSIRSRKEFKALFSKLENWERTQSVPLGLLMRRLSLAPRVGMSNAEFQQLPLYCPFLEYLDFNPQLWNYFSYTNGIKRWTYLSQFPCMQRLQLTVPILRDTGQHLTYLEMKVDDSQTDLSVVVSLLGLSPNLTCLQLDSGIKVGTTISISDFESIHTLCPRLRELELSGFHARLFSKDGYLVDMETLPIAHGLRQLRLDLCINHESFLDYWGHKYPELQTLDLQLKILEPEYFHEPVEGEHALMKASFTHMASQFKQLVKLSGQFDEKYFPCDVFLRGMNSRPMESVSIHFYNFDYLRRSARNFKILMNRSIETLKELEIVNWDRSWDYEQDILVPMGKMTGLRTLVLSPQPGTLTEFDLDVILDYCPGLDSLTLKNTYNLFVHCHDVTKRHGLKAFSLEHSMVNNALFDYLSIRCPQLTRLSLDHMTKPYDGEIAVKIHMPNHVFEFIHLRGLNLGLRMEDAGFQSNCSSTICSLEEKARSAGERWYHLYQPKAKHGHSPCPTLQRLHSVQKLKETKGTKELWETVAFAGVRLQYEPKKNWEFDIPFGFTSVKCRAVNEFRFEGVLVQMK
ncbi:hypothetical protein INT47_011683 [Mucor saturninus]|uniref:F-box domain-containing protein n=1 Tax=Mucor saturninus TaxID=64648 RepID=A0A8H7V710_9FUNG|nr:hypothetical protein INT47_011683 [Mucor saturninus]